MRSRYTAFVLRETDYLMETWHVDHRPARLELDDRVRWLGLDMIDSSQGATTAVVEFEARMLVAGEVSALRERSDFVLSHGRWFYTQGETGEPGFAPWRPGRNHACPCGSGLKFKRCCAG